MSRMPNSYTRAEWRNTTPVDCETETIGLGFDTAGGEVVRLAVSITSAKHIAESLHEFLSSHSVMSSGMPRTPGSTPLEVEKV